MNRILSSFLSFLILGTFLARADETREQVLIRDVTSVEGVRENHILGYGMVAGLKGTGDRQQTIFSVQTLANILQHMGVQIPPATVTVKNVAAVFVTADLPPFAAPGTHIDVTIAAIGDARSLEGGVLLLTPLYAADGKIYAAAQGPITLGGYTAGRGGNTKQVNHPTVGRLPGGGIVERDSSLDLHTLTKLSLMLNEPDFNTASEVAGAINKDLGKTVASVVDSRRVDIDNSAAGSVGVPALLARVQDLTIEVHHRARVVVNERTGTVVMGKDVRLGAVSILHGSLSIVVATELSVSQPNPLSQGKTEVVPDQTVKAEQDAARSIELTEGASVEQLVNGLQRIGATATDVIAILQAIKAAGALQGDLEVI